MSLGVDNLREMLQRALQRAERAEAAAEEARRKIAELTHAPTYSALSLKLEAAEAAAEEAQRAATYWEKRWTEADDLRREQAADLAEARQERDVAEARVLGRGELLDRIGELEAALGHLVEMILDPDATHAVIYEQAKQYRALQPTTDSQEKGT